jgi:hypothetical protein
MSQTITQTHYAYGGESDFGTYIHTTGELSSSRTEGRRRNACPFDFKSPKLVGGFLSLSGVDTLELVDEMRWMRWMRLMRVMRRRLAR